MEVVGDAEHEIQRRYPGERLTSNRPGSWEADLLAQMLQSGGFRD